MAKSEQATLGHCMMESPRIRDVFKCCLFRCRLSLLRLIATVGLLILLHPGVRAQWVVAAQDKDRRDLNGMVFIDNRFGWVIGNKGLLLSTIDLGDEWVEMDAGVGGANLKDLFFLNREVGWLVSSGGRLLTTADGGETWRVGYELNLPRQGFNSVFFASKKKGWVVGTDGRILHTSDGGRQWQRQESGTRAELVHVRFADDERG